MLVKSIFALLPETLRPVPGKSMLPSITNYSTFKTIPFGGQPWPTGMVDLYVCMCVVIIDYT